MATNAREARAESTLLFSAAWAGLTIEPKIIYDNEPRGEKVANLDEWVGFSWNEGNGTVAALGNNFFRIFGNIVIELYSASGRGTRRMDELKDLALMTFQTAPSGEVVYLNPSPLAVDPEGKWYRKNVLVDFYYDEYRP